MRLKIVLYSQLYIHTLINYHIRQFGVSLLIKLFGTDLSYFIVILNGKLGFYYNFAKYIRTLKRFG